MDQVGGIIEKVPVSFFARPQRLMIFPGLGHITGEQETRIVQAKVMLAKFSDLLMLILSFQVGQGQCRSMLIRIYDIPRKRSV